MVNSVSGDYNSWLESLHARGIKTTSTGKNEANFADYVGALSENLKQEIAASFDTEADKSLQSKLASVLRGNLIQSTDLKSALSGTGITYSVEYRQTSYIVDNKKGGSYMNNKNATQGSIAVYTFRDQNGGEIKIADANGNGALESEELFMNELLTGVVSDISASGAGAAQNTQAQMQAQIEEQMRLLEEQFKQTQQQLEEMMRQIEEQTKASLMKADSNGNGVVETDEFEEFKNDSDKKEQAEEELRTNITKIIEDNYKGISDSRLEDVVDYVVDHITTGTDLNITQLLDKVLGKEQDNDDK